MREPTREVDADLTLLICRHLDAQLNADETAALADRLRNDDDARRLLIELTHQSRHLCESLRDRAIHLATEPAASDDDEAVGHRRIAWLPVAAAAAVALIASVTMLLLHHSPRNNTPLTRPQPIALLTDLAGSARFNDAQTPPQLGADLPAGRLSLASGRSQLLFRSGAVVELTGPAEFDTTNANRGRLIRGRLHAVVPRRAIGFTVDGLAGFSVIDRGTQFTLAIHSPGYQALTVEEGHVEMRRPGAQPQLLAAGEGRLVDPDGGVRALDLTRPAPAYEMIVRDDQPQVYWRFNHLGEDQHTIVNDAPATAQPDAAGDLSARLVGSAALSEGVNPQLMLYDTTGAASVTCNAMRQLMVGESYTVELWFLADHPQTGTLFSLGDAVYIGLVNPSGHPTIRYLHRRIADGASGGTNIYTPYTVGRWHHLAAVKTPTEMSLYLDGRFIASEPQPTGLDAPADAFALGRLSTSHAHNDRPLIGRLDDVAVYTRPLPADRIRLHAAFAADLFADTPENTSPAAAPHINDPAH